MSEAVASQTQFRPAWLSGCGPSADTLREQIADFEELVETMLKRYEQMDRELKDVKAERDRLREENERLKSE